MQVKSIAEWEHSSILLIFIKLPFVIKILFCLFLSDPFTQVLQCCFFVQDKYVRALAETENVRRRMRKQIDEAKVFGIQGFCKDLLEVADILRQATESTPKDELTHNQHLKNLYEGLTLTNSQMLKVFAKHELHPIAPSEGEKFDPFLHEAMFQVPAQEAEKDGTIAIIQKTGFRLHDRTIRPALVGVFKAS